MDKITMKNMKFFAYHGALQKEREQGQYFYLDVEMYVDLKKSSISDNLEETINYAKAYDEIKMIVTKNKFRLIEKLAGSISREMLSNYKKLKTVVVRVRKPNAPIDGEFDYMEVEIKRDRDEI